MDPSLRAADVGTTLLSHPRLPAVVTASAPRYGVLRPCRNRAGYETEPEVAARLDLVDLERRASPAGLEALVNAGSILVLRAGAVEFSVFDSGKMLFKTRDVTAALDAMRAAFGALGWVWAEPRVSDVAAPK